MTNVIYDNMMLIEKSNEYYNEEANMPETKIIEEVDNNQDNIQKNHSVINNNIPIIHSKNQEKIKALANCILTIKKKGFRETNFIHHKNVNMFNIIEKCVYYDVQNESFNSELL